MSFLVARGIVKSYPVGGMPLTVLRNLDLEVAQDLQRRAADRIALRDAPRAHDAHGYSYRRACAGSSRAAWREG